MPDAVADEPQVLAGLAPLPGTDLRARSRPELFCADARGGAIRGEVSAALPCRKELPAISGASPRARAGHSAWMAARWRSSSAPVRCSET